MAPRTSSTSKLLLLGTRGKLPVLPVRLGFEGARYSVLRGLLASAPPSDAPFCVTDASAAAEGPAAAARNATWTVKQNGTDHQIGASLPCAVILSTQQCSIC